MTEDRSEHLHQHYGDDANPLHCDITVEDTVKVRQWLEENIGERDDMWSAHWLYHRISRYYFRTEEDLMLFKLRWE